MPITLKTDPEFRTLIPDPPKEEYCQLKENIRRDGCRDAIVVWNGIIIDGHNRYKICHELNIEFQTIEKNFNDRSEVLRWMILNQFGRRNISNFQRAKLAIKLESLFKEKAKENQGTRNDINFLSNLSKSCEPPSIKESDVKKVADSGGISTRKEVAKLARISEGTISKTKNILKRADEPTIEKLETGKASIHEVYENLCSNSAKKKKACTKCGETKRVEEFPPDRNVCNECRKIQRNSKNVLEGFAEVEKQLKRPDEHPQITSDEQADIFLIDTEQFIFQIDTYFNETTPIENLSEHGEMRALEAVDKMVKAMFNLKQDILKGTKGHEQININHHG